MYDELIKNLRGRSQFLLPHYGEETSYDSDLMKQAADAIEELVGITDRLKWIPVTERLPEDLTRVIVFCEDGVSYGLCEHLITDDTEVVEWHDFLHYPITPTHWMPLPTPPKEGKP